MISLSFSEFTYFQTVRWCWILKHYVYVWKQEDLEFKASLDYTVKLSKKKKKKPASSQVLAPISNPGT